MKKKLIFAIKSLNGVGGGAEKVFVEVVNGLHDRGYNIKVLTFDGPGSTFYPLYPNIPRIHMGLNLSSQILSRMEILLKLPKLIKTLSDERPNIVVAFMHSAFVPVGLASAGLGIPFIVSEHTEARHYDSRPLQLLLRKLVDRYAALRTVPTELVRKGYTSISGRASDIVPNPVNVDQLGKFIGRVPDCPPVVVSVGTLRVEKDHALLIDAFAQVEREFPDWRLKIVGDGPLRQTLTSQIARLGLRGRVDLPGGTREVGAAYASSRFIVIPSKYEAFGLVAAEALAVGRAVLAFDDCAGIVEIVESGQNGLLVPGLADKSDRTAALANGLRHLMGKSNLAEQLGRAGPASVELFRLDRVLDIWESLLNKVP